MMHTYYIRARPDFAGVWCMRPMPARTYPTLAQLARWKR